jgi:hypothetical protein
VVLITSLVTGCGGSAVSQEAQGGGGTAGDAAADVVSEGAPPDVVSETSPPVDVHVDEPSPPADVVQELPEPQDAKPDADCTSGQWNSYVVEAPPPNVDPALICPWTASPVPSDKAAQVTFNIYSQNAWQAIGHIKVDPAILGSVQGSPTVEVTSAPDADLQKLQVTGMQPTADGFTFQATWPQALYLHPGMGMTRMIVRTTLAVQCNGQSKTVESLTYVDLCGAMNAPMWVSSYETCNVCEQLCEMAPTPIMPSAPDDALPLPRAMRASVSAIARAGGALVVCAEHDPAHGEVTLDWHVSAGEIVYEHDGVVVWKLPDEPGPHQIQVAVRDAGAAAVASLRYDLAA